MPASPKGLSVHVFLPFSPPHSRTLVWMLARWGGWWEPAHLVLLLRGTEPFGSVTLHITLQNPIVSLSSFLLAGKQQVLGLCELVKFCEHRPSTMPLRQVISERMPQPRVHVAQHTGFPAPANSPLLRLTAGTGNWSVIRPQNTPGFRAFVRGWGTFWVRHTAFVLHCPQVFFCHSFTQPLPNPPTLRCAHILQRAVPQLFLLPVWSLRLLLHFACPPFTLFVFEKA